MAIAPHRKIVRQSDAPCMCQGSGAQRRPVGGSTWPRGVSAHHMECVGQPGSHVRTSYGSYFTRPFRRFSADWDSSRRCSSSSEHNHGPRESRSRTYFRVGALFFEYRSCKWVRSIRRVPPDRSHPVLAQTGKKSAPTRKYVCKSHCRLNYYSHPFPFLIN